MTRFDAVYGDAFAAVEKVLAAAPLTPEELRTLLGLYMTPDGAAEALKKLTDGRWPLLVKNERGLYESLLPPAWPRPMTTLELRWLKSLSEDARAALFLTDEQLNVLREALGDMPPLFGADEIICFDGSQTGDDFADAAYRRHFHTILRAFREGRTLDIRYVSRAGREGCLHLTPERLEYSARDRCFRLHGESYGRCWILNLARIEAAACGNPAHARPAPACDLCAQPLVIHISNERNALSRFMLEFSCFRKESTIDPQTGMAVARVWYPVKDETEVLIRVLSFGPAIRVTAPEHFVQRIRERVSMQPEIENAIER